MARDMEPASVIVPIVSRPLRASHFERSNKDPSREAEVTLTNSRWQQRGATGACIVAVWLLASCASPEQITQMNEEQCASYGLERGTTDFAACMTREELGNQYFHSYMLPSMERF
jgi:hypothetical protein